MICDVFARHSDSSVQLCQTLSDQPTKIIAAGPAKLIVALYTTLIWVRFGSFDEAEQVLKTPLSDLVMQFMITLTEWFFSHVRFSVQYSHTQHVADLYIQSIKRALTEGHLRFPFPAITSLDRRVKWALSYLESPDIRRFDIKATAKAALTSERNLYYLMKRQLDVTPYQFYLKSRLIQVRNELLTCECDRPSISWHAMSFGFRHLSRFSAHYQRLFGELPSTTLEWHLKNRLLCGDGC